MAEITKQITRLRANGLSLQQTLFCGQSFSWKTRPDGWHIGVAENRAVAVNQDADHLLLARPDGSALSSQDIAYWKQYFALDMDYAQLHQQYRSHPALADCVDSSPGIRVLRQPFFDTLLCFIISQNNHIPRITGIAQRLREEFGHKISDGIYSFPSPQTLAALEPEDLASLRAGFRARYLIDAARKVSSNVVDTAVLETLQDSDAREHLKQIVGVGNKVADCVLLFGLGRHGIAPMDVWMKRAMSQLFPEGMPESTRGSEGIAQQYIFWWARENL